MWKVEVDTKVHIKIEGGKIFLTKFWNHEIQETEKR